MEKIDILKKLSTLRKQELHSIVGTISADLATKLMNFADNQDNNVAESLHTRYSQSVSTDHVKSHYEYLVKNYVQVYLDQSLIDEVEKALSINTKELRVAVMKPGFGLDWHVDFDDQIRLHCDLNLPSDFMFKIKNQEIVLDKAVGTVYKINTAHTHKVFNYSDTSRYALVGCIT